MKESELEKLILQFFDQEIDEQDFSRLEEELSLNEKSREIYQDFLFLESQLQALPLSCSILQSRPSFWYNHRHALRTTLAAAAGILLFLATSHFFTSRPTTQPPESLSFRLAPDSKFEAFSDQQGKLPLSQSEIESGQLAIGSSLELSQGAIELEFPSGVRSIISPPANITLSTENRITIHEGSAWFQVPEEGHGFQVETGKLVITDYGTEFGVIHVPGSTDEVHVFDGSVHVQSLIGLKEEAVLSKGESRRVRMRGGLGEAPELAAPFLKELPEQLPYLHFAFDHFEEERTLVSGAHPALAGLSTKLVQSDGGSSSRRVTNGRFGRAISFDGKGDFVETNWHGIFGAQPVTVAFWIKPAERRNLAGIIGWGHLKSGATNEHLHRQWKFLLPPENTKRGLPPVFRCAWGMRFTKSAPVDLPTHEWSHLAVVYSGAGQQQEPELSFYLNGEEIPQISPRRKRKKPASPPRRPKDFNKTIPLIFGHPINWKEGSVLHEENFFSGELDEVFIIEGALDQEQIQGLLHNNSYASAREVF